MRVMSVTTNLTVSDMAQAKAFWSGLLGLTTEEMDLGWVARLTDPSTGAHVQLVTKDATAPEDSARTVNVDDVDEAWRQVQAEGIEVIHPPVTEAWGVRRFFVRAPGGTVVNIAQHHV